MEPIHLLRSDAPKLNGGRRGSEGVGKEREVREGNRGRKGSGKRTQRRGVGREQEKGVITVRVYNTLGGTSVF